MNASTVVTSIAILFLCGLVLYSLFPKTRKVTIIFDAIDNDAFFSIMNVFRTIPVLGLEYDDTSDTNRMVIAVRKDCYKELKHLLQKIPNTEVF